MFGATFAYRAKQAGKSCHVLDKRPHLGGNVYCENVEGIYVHKYGAHIFHTSNKEVWDFVNSLVPFNRYTNSPVANFHGELYNLPFNMNTFSQLWGVRTPDHLDHDGICCQPDPGNPVYVLSDILVCDLRRAHGLLPAGGAEKARGPGPRKELTKPHGRLYHESIETENGTFAEDAGIWTMLFFVPGKN